MKKQNLPEFIKALKKPGVKLAETHISWVLIGPRYTLKIKKPVKFNFLDFSSLAKRKHFCEEELKLNQRFSPSIYLGLVPIFAKDKRKIIDYAVMMKTLPSENRLDRLLSKNKVTPQMIKKITEEIWRFHRRAKTGKTISNFGKPDHLRRVYEKDFKALNQFIGKSLSENTYRQIHAFTTHFLARRRDLFNLRIKEKAIRDMHGDLHSENIFYYKKPYIFDCIEFNSDFRYIDRAAEIGFLLMDLEFRGKANLAKLLLQTYLQKSRDYDLLKLLNFYICHFARVEGLVYSLSGNFKLARRYLQFALSYVKAKPCLIAVGGLIGTGKSTLAKALAGKLGAIILQTDAIRKEFESPSPYSLVCIRKTYQTLFSRAEKLLKQGRSVVLDASFSKKLFRKRLIKLAVKTNADFLFVETVLPDKLILKRLQERPKGISDAGPQLLVPFKKNYEPPAEIHAYKVITIGSKKSILKKVLARIGPGF
ncbi:MAG: AAA family ATPase [Candidatus Margulisiibacteriota bacterium]